MRLVRLIYPKLRLECKFLCTTQRFYLFRKFDFFTHRLHSVLLLLESALFGLFVIAIMVDQMHAIMYDETAVEAVQLKGLYRPYRPKYMLLADVCGRGHPALWLLPCAGNNGKKYDTPLLSHDV